MSENLKIAYQGVPGAYSEAAALAAFPTCQPQPHATFAAAFAAVSSGAADRAMIPIENMVAGRVADVHALLPTAGLYAVGEYYLPIQHHLLALPGTTLAQIKTVLSHIQGLSQCRDFITKHNLTAEVFGDTAGAAAELLIRKDPSLAAIASKRAGEIYGLQSLAADIADLPNNTTRFLVLARAPQIPATTQDCLSSFCFNVKSVPAALYKALGGFATNGVNLTKIESYLDPQNFQSAMFYVEVEGHPADPALQRAFTELQFFAAAVKQLGTFKKAGKSQIV